MRGNHDWRDFLQNNAKSLTLPVPPRAPERRVTIQHVCHGIPRQPLDPTMHWRPMSCHLLSLPCLVVLRQITCNIPKKKIGVVLLCNVERAMAFIQCY